LDDSRLRRWLQTRSTHELKVPKTAGDLDCRHIGQALGSLRSKFPIEIVPISDSEKERT
jgi:hypothetical protein